MSEALNCTFICKRTYFSPSSVRTDEKLELMLGLSTGGIFIKQSSGSLFTCFNCVTIWSFISLPSAL